MSVTVQSRDNYHTIDLVKFIMAVFVVAIHTAPLYNIHSSVMSTLFDCIVRCAVPFFFLSSSFFLKKKSDSVADTSSVIRRYRTKITFLYFCWSIIYMPLAVVYFYSSKFSFTKSVLLYLRGILLVGENYNSWMLWYLLSTIYTLLFVSVLLKLHFRIFDIALGGSLVYLVGLLISDFVAYSGPLSHSFLFLQSILSKTIVNGRLFTGFFYIPFGMWLATKKIPINVGVLLTLAGFFGNYFYEGLIGDCMLTICSVGLFIVVSQISLPDSSVYFLLRKASTVVYFIHMYIWTLYYTLVHHQKTYGFDSFVFTTCFSILCAFVWLYLQRRFLKQH